MTCPTAFSLYPFVHQLCFSSSSLFMDEAEPLLCFPLHPAPHYLDPASLPSCPPYSLSAHQSMPVFSICPSPPHAHVGLSLYPLEALAALCAQPPPVG